MTRETSGKVDKALAHRIGERARTRRKELGLSQEALGYPRYTKSYISQIEQGRTVPSIACLVYLAERLGRPLDWFVADNPDYQSPLCKIANEMGVDPGKLREALVWILDRS